MDLVLPFVVSGLGIGAVYALSGVGLVVLFRASGVLNFAFGAIGAVGAHVAWSILQDEGSQAAAWGAAIAVSTVISLAYGRLLAPRLSQREVTIRSIATLGLALMLMGLTEWGWGEGPRRLVLPTDADGLELGDVRLTWTRVLGLAAAVTMMAAVGALLARTRVGLRMRALADDRGLSAVLGVDVIGVDTLAWMLSGAFAGVCGMLLANIVRLQPTLLTFLVIPAFAAAIVGRLQSLPVTVAAGVLIGVLEAVAILLPGVAPLRTAVPFLVALGAILFFRNTTRKA
ncbi:branched-chain amino acid ABC transporter permease [Pseudaquabacterium rugosum]|uniref:Branched-chain amino acid ABC transporter permease n=1 Tax=Pseudaquabacterium rugosum TaxID=2984194 RepID=A0ABU9BEQ5_9BURK